MAPIRVHVGPMPEMLRAITADLLGLEPDIVIAGTSTDREDCLRAARRDKAEIILAQDHDDHSGSCLDLMLAEPALGLLAVSVDGESATRVTLSRQSLALDPASRTNLTDAIRSLAGELRAGVGYTHSGGSPEVAGRARPHGKSSVER